MARLLQADAAIRAHNGDLDGALDSCRAILGAGRSIGDEPFVISQLVRIAIGMLSRRNPRAASWARASRRTPHSPGSRPSYSTSWLSRSCSTA